MLANNSRIILLLMGPYNVLFSNSLHNRKQGIVCILASKDPSNGVLLAHPHTICCSNGRYHKAFGHKARCCHRQYQR